MEWYDWAIVIVVPIMMVAFLIWTIRVFEGKDRK